MVLLRIELTHRICHKFKKKKNEFWKSLSNLSILTHHWNAYVEWSAAPANWIANRKTPKQIHKSRDPYRASINSRWHHWWYFWKSSMVRSSQYRLSIAVAFFKIKTRVACAGLLYNVSYSKFTFADSSEENEILCVRHQYWKRIHTLASIMHAYITSHMALITLTHLVLLQVSSKMMYEVLERNAICRTY